MARAIFKDWFVDFGPTRAKMEGRAPYLAPDSWALFPDRLDDEGRPNGWTEGTLGDSTGLQSGYAFKSSDWVSEGVPVVKIGSVRPAVVDLSGASYVSPSIAAERSSFSLARGDILVGLTGYVGETGRVPPVMTAPLLNQRVGRFRPHLGRYSFVLASVREGSFKTYAEARSHGSAQANVSTVDLLRFPLIRPCPQAIAAFEDMAGPLFERHLSNVGEGATLAATRDLLLPKLMSGEIRIRDAKAMIADAA